MLVARIILIFTCFSFAIGLRADICTLDNANDLNGPFLSMGGIVGQQFIACETGTINSITVNTSGGEVNLYLAIGNGSTITAGDIFESFPTQPAGAITLQLTKPFPVQEQAQYAFGIMGPAMVRLDADFIGPPANTIDPDGLFLFGIEVGGTFSEIQASDLFFALTIELTSIELTSIPTMNEWGLVIFGLLVLNMAIFFIQRKEFISPLPTSINH